MVVRGDAVVPLEPGFEHGLIVLDAAVEVAGPAPSGPVLTPGHLGYLGAGRSELALRPVAGGKADGGPARVMLLGGEPLGEQLVMWWNFVARTRAEIDEAYASWAADDGRFPAVASPLARIPTGPPWWQQEARR